MRRPTKLLYKGKPGMAREGDFFQGVPARDLEEADIAQLDDETLRNITGTPANDLGPLYVESREGQKKTAAKKAPAKRQAPTSAPTRAPEPAPTEPAPAPPEGEPVP